MTHNPKTGPAARIRHAFARWRIRMQERDALASMGHRELRDIGLTPAEARIEAGKPFWIA
ncbi:DUF1127 domain-containing protein [Falsiroseomonas oryzae]|uniref:DUF1127 domain-containing protein n=1 Tax=Falsiroseomonas oryzae TaxID=2766473 RepID=UPI0022EB196F|nr:DUF1127 domain-containing protein [Roseomonas sp. MO-31]